MKSKYLVLLAIAFFFINRTNAQFGALDTSFNGTGKTTTNFNGTDGATGITIQTDGKIIVSGYTPVGNSYGYALSRYNTNGTLDASFGTGGKIITDFATGYDFAACV